MVLSYLPEEYLIHKQDNLSVFIKLKLSVCHSSRFQWRFPLGTLFKSLSSLMSILLPKGISKTQFLEIASGNRFPEFASNINIILRTLTSFRPPFKDFILYVWVVCLHVCICMCKLPEEAGRGHQIPQNWNYRWLLATIWILRTKPLASERAASTLILWTISTAPYSIFLSSSWCQIITHSMANVRCPCVLGEGLN